MKKALLLTFLSLMTSPCTLAMEKETPEFYTSLPTELRSELVAAVFKTNSSTYASMKTVKKLMLTSKQTQMQLKQFFTSDDKITDYCFALKSNTENIFRSLYLFNVYKFIPKQKYNQLDAQFFVQYRDEYDAHNQDEQTFIAEFISDEFINRNISSSDLSKLQQWINKGVNVNILGLDNSTALILSAIRGHTAIVKILLDVPTIDVNSQSNHGNTALNAACQVEGDHTDVVKLLLATPGIDINSKNNTGLTALIAAAACGHAETVKLLLAVKGIEVNCQEELVGNTALIWAANQGYIAIVKELIKAPGIDDSIKNKNGLAALNLARNKAISRVLIKFHSM